MIAAPSSTLPRDGAPSFIADSSSLRNDPHGFTAPLLHLTILASVSLAPPPRVPAANWAAAVVDAIVALSWRSRSEWSAPLAVGDYLRIFRRFWWVVLLATLIGVAVGYATMFMSTTQYSSTTRLFVTTQSGTSVGDAYQNNLFSQERVFSYAGLATSDQVAARAIAQLKAPISVDELRAKITAMPLPQTVLLDITATDPDPAAAQRYANAVADQLVNVTAELETSRRGGEAAAAAVLVDDASYGAKVESMGLPIRLAAGAVGGLVLGVLVAVLLGISDSKVRRRERIEDVTGVPLLGTLVADAQDRTGVIDTEAGGLAVERLRELRTNVQFARNAHGQHPRVIAVTSPSPQDGRSTTAIDLAASFAEAGHSVVLVDGDLVKPDLPELLALDSAAVKQAGTKGFSTLLAGQHDLSESLIEVPGSRVALLPAGPVPSVRRDLWGDQRTSRVLELLRGHFEYVIIDTPPLTKYADGTVPAALGDGALVLGRIGHTKASALRQGVTALQTAHATVLGVVATFEPGHRRELSADRKHGGAAAGSAKTGDARDTDDETAKAESPASAKR
ncbi:P-loop NTPase [Mycolicibacterium neoaurum]|nr:polysaccharide biosynthesis tyrosine autokinase [Mycolicibacterium neoaurum]WBP93003.1 P-loop NTPase [Mycolicibacterium neoaurum]WBS06651.1 P-loop NTPase [Mycolicibacterium neoaurum]